MSMVGIGCYHSPSSRHSGAYEPSYARNKVEKRGRKNLFRTALDKLTKKHKNRKTASENVYEVIVIYKDRRADLENDDSKYVDTNNENKISKDVINKTTYTTVGSPKAPPRTRSRPNSRNSCKNSDLYDIPPTPPPRSRSHSQRSSMIKLDRAPTPPPRSRPQSRNSCRGSIQNAHKVNNHPPDLQSDKKSDISKPPIPPMRSPLRKQRKQIVGRSAEETKSIRQSVSLADLASVLDYIDGDHMEETEIEKKPSMLKSASSTSKLYNSEDILASNARVESRWATVMKSSSLSLDRQSRVEEQETYLGPGLSSDHRTQSYSGLAQLQQDTSQVPENNLGQMAPKDRVKLSLGRLDIPDWYQARQEKEDTEAPISQRTAWKGSFPNLQKASSKSTPCSPLPPSSPTPSNSNWRNNLRDKSFSPTSPSPQAKQPYTGWRSQEKLPVFLPEGMNSRLEKERTKSRRD